MTPERKEEIKRDAESGKGYEDAFILNKDVLELLATLEEAQQQIEYLKERRNLVYEIIKDRDLSLAEAQQTIARQREALEEVAERSLYYLRSVALKALNSEEGETLP